MKVKLFDFECEKTLEEEVNNFLKQNIKLIDIKYQISHFSVSGEQIYSFSCLILYENA